MTRLTDYPQKFLALLFEQDGGIQAIDRLARNAVPFPSAGKEEEAFNRALLLYLQGGFHRELPPFDRITMLSFLRPRTVKKPKNARMLCPGFAETEEAWKAALDEVLLELTHQQARVIADWLQRRRSRLLAIKRYPEPGRLPIIEENLSSDENVRVFLAETERRGSWRVVVEHSQHGTLTGPYYKFHTISPHHLLTEHALNVTGCGAKVLSIYAESPNAEPAACEVILRPGNPPRISPWRRGVGREALLRHRGQCVRLGDVIFFVSKPEYTHLCPGVLPSYLNRIEGLPTFLGLDRSTIGAEDAIFKPDIFPVRLRHPDHYEVVIEGSPGDVIYATQIIGQTDFIPRMSCQIENHKELQ